MKIYQLKFSTLENWFVFGLIIPNSVLKEISGDQNIISRTAAPACLARRDTMAKAEPFKEFCSNLFPH